jgi:osmotically-inducible protein OsmY
VILTEFLTDPGRFTVTVKDGVVTLEESPETTDNGLSIARESRQVEGVVAVHDRLRYPPEQ